MPTRGKLPYFIDKHVNNKQQLQAAFKKWGTVKPTFIP